MATTQRWYERAATPTSQGDQGSLGLLFSSHLVRDVFLGEARLAKVGFLPLSAW